MRSRLRDAEPGPPGRKLRTVKRDDFPHLVSRKVTLVLTTGDPDFPPRFGVTVGDKRDLLMAVTDHPCGELVAVWTGRDESHAFAVTDELAAEWLAEIEGLG